MPEDRDRSKIPLYNFRVMLKLRSGAIIQERIGRCIDAKEAASFALEHHPGGKFLGSENTGPHKSGVA